MWSEAETDDRSGKQGEWGCCERGADDDSDEECLKTLNPNGKPGETPASKSAREWVIYKRRVDEISARSKACGLLCFTTTLLILCFASFALCQSCLFAILILCACLCPFYPVLNAPLWLAIILLTIGGWSFTTGALSVTWNAKVVQ